MQQMPANISLELRTISVMEEAEEVLSGEVFSCHSMDSLKQEQGEVRD